MEPTKIEKLAEVEIARIKLDFAKKPFTLENLRDAILQIADALVGVSEIGNTNKGYFVNKFLKDVGLGGGYAWCLAYAQYVLRVATQIWQKDLDILPYNTGSTKSLYDHYEKKENLVHTNPDQIEPGDIIVFRNGTLWTGHVGIVEKYDPETNIITTNEGNTNSQFSREGGSIERHQFNLFKYGPIGKTRGATARYTRGFISMRGLFIEYLNKYSHDTIYSEAKMNQFKSENLV